MDRFLINVKFCLSWTSAHLSSRDMAAIMKVFVLFQKQQTKQNKTKKQTNKN